MQSLHFTFAAIFINILAFDPTVIVVVCVNDDLTGIRDACSGSASVNFNSSGYQLLLGDLKPCGLYIPTGFKIATLG